MKLNKKLLTAALAGALIVQAVPATTFAQEPAGQETARKVGLERILDRLAKFNTEFENLTKQKRDLVSKVYREQKENETDEQYEAALKGKFLVLQEKTDADAKDVAAKQKAYDEARKAYDKAQKDEVTAQKQLEAAQKAFAGKNKAYQDEKDAAKAALDKAIADAEEAEKEVLRTKDHTVNSLKKELDLKEQEELNAERAAAKADKSHAKELDRKYADATAAKEKVAAQLEKAEKDRDELVENAKATKEAAIKKANDNYEEELDKIEFKYVINFNIGNDSSELNKFQRAYLEAKKAHKDAEDNVKTTSKAVDDALTALTAAKDVLSKSNEESYKAATELKRIEKELSEVILKIEKLLGNENVNIKSIAGKVNDALYKNLDLIAKMSDSQKLALIAKQNKEYNELLAKYNKIKGSTTDVKPLVTYKFTVKDTAGKGVEGLTLQLTKVSEPSVVRVATSDKDGVILIPGMEQGRYSVAVKKIPDGYEVYQGGKKVSEVQALFKAASEVKAENNAEAVTGAKKDEKKETKSKIELPETVDVGETSEDSSKPADKKDEKVVDGGTIVVQKKKKEDKKEVKKPAKPAKKVKKAKKKLPKAGVAAEAATIAAAAMATMGGAFLSLKKRK